MTRQCNGSWKLKSVFSYIKIWVENRIFDKSESESFTLKLKSESFIITHRWVITNFHWMHQDLGRIFCRRPRFGPFSSLPKPDLKSRFPIWGNRIKYVQCAQKLSTSQETIGLGFLKLLMFNKIGLDIADLFAVSLN